MPRKKFKMLDPDLLSGKHRYIQATGFELVSFMSLIEDSSCDRAMVCGSEAMLKDTCIVLEEFGLEMSPRIGETGDYVIEKAFAEK